MKPLSFIIWQLWICLVYTTTICCYSN